MTDSLDAVWRALADPTRRRLLDLLRDGPRTTGDLCAAFPVSRFAVMKHLDALEAAGLVLVRRRGRERWNHLNAARLGEAIERWTGPYQALWAASLLNLKRRSETGEEEPNMPTATLDVRTIQMEQEVQIAAPPARVFDCLTAHIGDWWSHSFSGSPRTIRLEPFPGGRFFEEFDGAGGGALYATVTFLKPGERLRLTGPMGMAGAVAGVIDIRLEATGDGTRLLLSHHVLGEVDDATANDYNGGWQHLLGERLRPYAEGAAAEA
jgi:DNA-binding transcriptional ArsR family regulator/uncharacterized protein YndB with AHSA1/START domain